MVGGLLGAAVPAFGSAVSYWLVDPLLAFLFAVGVIPGLICGVAFAPEAVRTDDPAFVAGKAAFVAAPLGFVALMFTVPLLSLALSGVPDTTPLDALPATPTTYEPSTGPAPVEPMPMWPAAPLLGLAGAGLFLLLIAVFSYAIGMPIGFPSALAAIIALRQIVRLPIRIASGVLVAVALALTAAVMSAAVDARQRNQEMAIGGGIDRARWINLVTSDVDLEWSVINRTPFSYTFVLEQPQVLDDWGQVHFVAPCQTTAGVAALHSQWLVRLQRESDFARTGPGRFERPPRALASSEIFHGDNVQMQVEIASDGVSRVTEGVGIPSLSDLAAPVCWPATSRQTRRPNCWRAAAP